MKDNNVINYYMDKQSGIVYKKYEEKGEIVPVPRKEKPDPLRDAFRRTITRFAPLLSEVMGEHFGPEDSVGVMWAVMDYRKNADADDEEERIRDYHETLRHYMPYKRADVIFQKTRYVLDKLVSVFDEPTKETTHSQDLNRDDEWDR